MAEHRKVPSVTLSACTALSPPAETRKRHLEADSERSGSRDPGSGASEDPESGRTVRLTLSLSEPTELRSPEFIYPELIRIKKNLPGASPAVNHYNNEGQEKQDVEALVKKFENKYGAVCKRKRQDRVQDLIDIGFGYDENDSFIDNSEAYDELVPASLTTKFGGFYINTGTLQFRTTSESESDDADRAELNREEEDCELRKRRRDDLDTEERRLQRSPSAASGVHQEMPDRKRRRKLKDSLCLATMLRRFAHEKEEVSNVKNSLPHLHGNDMMLSDLTSDPAMMSLLNSANDSELQELLKDLDFSELDGEPQQHTESREMGGAGMNQGASMIPPPLPEGLPTPLLKRIEDLRVASRRFDQQGRKKFFTMDMNNILLDIELQVQELSHSIRSVVYSHIQAFVPCNKEALLKRLRKLSFNIQDDCLRTPLMKLKLAVCSVMPEQTARYNMDCAAKAAAQQQIENGERNGSEDEEEERPGRRVIGPRKKFIWDDKLRTLLCNLVRVKLRCYEQEQSSLSVEDYLKAFMETELKPLWPKGWMQSRMLFKESRTVHSHLTDLGKKRIIPTSRLTRESAWTQGMHLSSTPHSSGPTPTPLSEPICLSDSLDDDLAVSSLDSIAHALSLLNDSANGINLSSTPSTSASMAVPEKSLPHTQSPASLFHAASVFKDGTLVPRQMNKPCVNAPPAKLRPPPTATPLQRPTGPKGCRSTPPSGNSKTVTKSYDGTAKLPSLHLQPNSLNPQILATPPSSPLLQIKAPPTGQQQGFITPMQATITKSSQSNSTPIIKLTHRPPTQATPPGSTHRPPTQATPPGSTHRPSVSSPTPNPIPRPLVSTPPSHRLPASSTPAAIHRSPAKNPPGLSTHRPPVSASSSTHNPILPPSPSLSHRSSVSSPPSLSSPSSLTQSRSQILTPPLSKSPGFRSPFSPSPVVKPHTASFQDCSLSPSLGSANHSLKQRAVGGANQSSKTPGHRASSLLRVPTPPDSTLLNQVSSLPLGMGVFGGLVPVSLPFQFPLLNFTQPGGATLPTTSGFTLSQNLLKSLQSGVQAALPPHLQLAFSDSNQSPGDELKRK